ncbi:hypothetical protein BDQ12DRAFT_718335 [Crucibulum laeve]|uniref:Extracellular membrane protein CFEM domain-containing protein n=1 Tax=Crucibulum laeve TaxID=68775 RepID=A0A5C3MEN8_9AGAR|nr:hypothetical protein BDQ12DRAFT_718335 [Crucibulum laeve]
MVSPIKFSFISVLATLNLAGATLHGVYMRNDPGVGHVLEARQAMAIPNVPPQCASLCNTVNTELAPPGCTVAECCTASFERAYFNCLTCFVQAANSTSIPDALSIGQGIMDGFVQVCAARGAAVPSLTLTAGAPSASTSGGNQVSSTSGRSAASSVASSAASALSSLSSQITITGSAPSLPSASSQISVTSASSAGSVSGTLSASTASTSPTSNSAVKMKSDYLVMLGFTVLGMIGVTEL